MKSLQSSFEIRDSLVCRKPSMSPQVKIITRKIWYFQDNNPELKAKACNARNPSAAPQFLVFCTGIEE